MSVGLRAALYLISPKKASRTRTKQNTEMEVRTKLRRAKKKLGRHRCYKWSGCSNTIRKIVFWHPHHTSRARNGEAARLRGRTASAGKSSSSSWYYKIVVLVVDYIARYKNGTHAMLLLFLAVPVRFSERESIWKWIKPIKSFFLVADTRFLIHECFTLSITGTFCGEERAL